MKNLQRDVAHIVNLFKNIPTLVSEAHPLMPGCLNNKFIVTRKFESMNHFRYYLCRQLKDGGMEICMKQAIKLLIEKVKEESQQILDYCQKNGEYSSDTFDPPYFFRAKTQNMEKIFKYLRAKYGIYIFVIDTDLTILKVQITEWNTVTGGLINNGNNEKDIAAKAGRCFYIGSCYQHSLMTRIREHFSEEKGPASLKLSNKKRSWIKKSLSVYCFPIKKEFPKEERRIILPAIEKELHTELKAIAGSSRT